METWPVSLPKPQKKFNAQLRSGLADDQEQINSQRTRTYPERESNFILILTQTQLETLRTFYETTLNGGGMLFEADWLTEAGFAFHRLRFLKPFETSLNGGMMWEVKMNLEIIAGMPFDGADPAYWPCSPAIPSLPANVQASDGAFTDKVQITWTASSGATSYEVYRADTEGGTRTLKGSPEINSFDDTTAIAPTVYYYWVKAVNASGASGFSSFDTGWRDEGLPDEYGYIYGGWDGSNRLQDCDQYTPDTWISKSSMPSPARNSLIASTIGSSGYVYGGHDGANYLQDCDGYTPDTWTSKSSMPLPARCNHAASTIGSSGYVYGGHDGANYLQDCDGYTPDTWTSKSDMPSPARHALAASTIGSSGYVYGGYDGANNLQDCDEYTPDTWVSKSNMPSPARRNLAASTIGSSGYIYGGRSAVCQDCDEYTPDTWVSKSNMPSPARYGLAASTIGSSGYVYGGNDDSVQLQDCDEYTPDIWTSKSDMPSPARHALAASTI